MSSRVASGQLGATASVPRQDSCLNTSPVFGSGHRDREAVMQFIFAMAVAAPAFYSEEEKVDNGTRCDTYGFIRRPPPKSGDGQYENRQLELLDTPCTIDYEYMMSVQSPNENPLSKRFVSIVMQQKTRWECY